MRHLSWVIVLALTACAHENEPEAVEPETTATSGGIIQGPPSPQASTPYAPAQASAPVEEHSTLQQYGSYRDPGAPGISYESNEALHARVHQALAADARVDESSIAVSVDGPVVFLGGAVSSDEQRRIAHEIVAQVPGVAQVFTHALRVRG